MTPDTLEAALDIIEDLKERLRGYEADSQPAQYGLSPTENKIYSLICKKGYISSEALLAAIYGLSETGSHQLIKVNIHKIRKKLPPEIKIVNIWGEGYRLERAH